MALMPATRATAIWREGVRGRVVVEQGISPTASVRKSRAILLYEEHVLESIRNIDIERSLRALFRDPLYLRDFRAVRKFLTISRDARFVGCDHLWVSGYNLK